MLWSPEHDDIISQRWDENVSRENIATELGVRVATLDSRLQNLRARGVPLKRRKPGQRSSWNEKWDGILIQRWEENVLKADIAVELGVASHLVMIRLATLRARGFPLKKNRKNLVGTSLRRFSKKIKVEVLRQTKAGVDQAEIARSFSLTVGQVMGIINRDRREKDKNLPCISDHDDSNTSFQSKSRIVETKILASRPRLDPRDLTAHLLGDPFPGRSALDQQNANGVPKPIGAEAWHTAKAIIKSRDNNGGIIMSEVEPMHICVEAYLEDTTRLSAEESGAYLLLLMSMWKGNGSVLDDDQDLARIVRLGKAKWKKVKEILRPLLTFEDGKISQKHEHVE